MVNSNSSRNATSGSGVMIEPIARPRSSHRVAETGVLNRSGPVTTDHSYANSDT